MKGLITAILLSLLLTCHGDVSEGRNHRLPLGAPATIPSPVQSLLPPSFENPIKDYTVGLVPPPEDILAKPNHHHHQVQNPIHQQHTHHSSGLITPAVSSRTIGQKHNGYSVGSVATAFRHQTHHSSNFVQPQVYQPKTAVYHQPNAQHHHHNHQPARYSTGLFTPPVAQHYTQHYSVPTTSQYYAPVTQRPVYRNYAPIPVHRAPTVQHVYPSVQRPVSSSGVRLIQSYPSISYAVAPPQHGSTLNLGNAKLEPELAYIISEVLGQYHF